MTPQRNTGAGAEAELPEYAGHYHLESCLGSGGMGVVHLARSTSGLRLAVKVVHAEFARDPEFRGRFRQEVAAARRVSGAFTAPVVDADPEAERPWMATLFIPGPTLSEHVKRNGPMPTAQLRRLMAGLAEALRDIHRVGVVHRDLKPSNVLLAEDGPKVIDFGISRPKDSELRTETGKLIGTPPFMAPEQFRRPREVGPAADIFALGSVMVHAATGRGPFDSDSPYVVAYQVVHDEPDLTGVPENLAPLVLRCLAKEPEDRPTPDELMRELRSVAASYDTQAFIPAQRTSEGDRGQQAGAERAVEQPVAQSGKRRRRGKRMAAVGAAALGLAVLGALSSVRLFDATRDTPQDGSPRTVSTASVTWAAGPVGAGKGMPQCTYGDGKLFCARPGVVFAVSPADGALLWRHSVAAQTTSEPPLVSAHLVQPYTSGGSRLAALAPTSGKEVWERRLPPDTTIHYAGDMALLTHADGTVAGVDAATGNTTWQRRFPGQGTPSFLSFSGDSLAYAARTSVDGSSTQVTAVDPGTGRVQWDVRLTGALRPFGAQGGSVFFLSVDSVYGNTKEVVRYTPASKKTRRVTLPVALDDAQATVRGHFAYLLATGGSLLAVDLDARKQLWRLETSVIRGSAPVADGKRVYFSSGDGRLLAADAAQGRLVGQTKARLGSQSGVVGAPPAPVIVGNRVFATAPDGTVFALDGRDPSAW
ncbi:serine/threonine-protein kinase [Streptomyces diastatochromogenes]|uniref:Serine/threonine protein kinase n=1 Tax=Streptomyces diastatochromogenes TaxID=42236 RepID=A0A233SD66_STRDA|nr:serine/threonine-protein kinase [Streptomyces diastatochromogenes]MCZ0987697.1 serine/threonine-protein kinase [Streptomyces diastatochromogenes]OXY93600.1 serine/threonine protein kinase [Streptomyces diastatochromogenes]